MTHLLAAVFLCSGVTRTAIVLSKPRTVGPFKAALYAEGIAGFALAVAVLV